MEERPRGRVREAPWQLAGGMAAGGAGRAVPSEYKVMGSVEHSYSKQMPALHINTHVQISLMSLRGVHYDSRPPGATEQVLLL